MATLGNVVVASVRNSFGQILQVLPRWLHEVLTFDDGHDSGLYDWKYLYHLCLNQDALWQDYLDRLEAAGKSRESSQINFKAL